MENSEKIYKAVLNLVYFTIVLCLIPIVIFSIEHLFEIQTNFFKFSSMPFTFLLVYCPVACILSSILFFGLSKGRKRLLGVLFLLFAVAWYLWFYNLVKDEF